MTEKQYETIIELLTDKVREQATTISLQKWQIDSLTAKLAEAEYHLNPHGKENPNEQ